MSESLKPWLARAVSDYRQKHGRNLTFPKSGRLLQVTQFNNYRNADVPADRALDVWAWAHDKSVELILRFDSQAINSFEEDHDSFTSYRYGLFHILEYKFVLGDSYIDEPPARGQEPILKPSTFYLHVTKFKYFSSKGEGNFASAITRAFTDLTQEWRNDIERNAEKKRGLVFHKRPIGTKSSEASGRISHSTNAGPSANGGTYSSQSVKPEQSVESGSTQAALTRKGSQPTILYGSQDLQELREQDVLDDSIIQSTPPPPSSGTSAATRDTSNNSSTPQAAVQVQIIVPEQRTWHEVEAVRQTSLVSRSSATFRNDQIEAINHEIEGKTLSQTYVQHMVSTVSTSPVQISSHRETTSQHHLTDTANTSLKDGTRPLSSPKRRRRHKKARRLPRFDLSPQGAAEEGSFASDADTRSAGAALLSEENPEDHTSVDGEVKTTELCDIAVLSQSYPELSLVGRPDLTMSEKVSPPHDEGVQTGLCPRDAQTGETIASRDEMPLSHHPIDIPHIGELAQDSLSNDGFEFLSMAEAIPQAAIEHVKETLGATAKSHAITLSGPRMPSPHVAFSKEGSSVPCQTSLEHVAWQIKLEGVTQTQVESIFRRVQNLPQKKRRPQ